MNLIHRALHFLGYSNTEESSESGIISTNRKRKLFEEDCEEYQVNKRPKTVDTGFSFISHFDWLRKKFTDMVPLPTKTEHKYLNEPGARSKTVPSSKNSHLDASGCVVISDDEDDEKHKNSRFKAHDSSCDKRQYVQTSNTRQYTAAVPTPRKTMEGTRKEKSIGKNKNGGFSMFSFASKKDKKKPSSLQPRNIIDKIMQLEEREQYRTLVNSGQRSNSNSSISSTFSRSTLFPSAIHKIRSSILSEQPSVQKAVLDPKAKSRLRNSIATNVSGRVIIIDDDSSTNSETVPTFVPPPPRVIRVDSCSSSDVSFKEPRSRSVSVESPTPPVVTLDSDSEVSQEHLVTITRKNGTVRSLASSPYSDPNFLDKMKEKYQSVQDQNDKNIKSNEVQIKIIRECNEATDKDLERRLRRHLNFKVREPVWEEDDEEEEEEEDVGPQLTNEMEDKINWALGGGSATQLLVQNFNIDVRRQDMVTLREATWLNDEIINYYMHLLVERGKMDNFPSVFAFDTHFFPGFARNGYARYKRWTKKIDIFANEIILFPIHVSEVHWCLAIVDFKDKSIKYYDSLGSDNKKCLDLLETYLKSEHQDKKGAPFLTNGWKKENVKKIPMQQNGSDCGMFTCKFADYLSRRAPITFTQEHIPYFRRKMVYEILTKKLL